MELHLPSLAVVSDGLGTHLMAVSAATIYNGGQDEQRAVYTRLSVRAVEVDSSCAEVDASGVAKRQQR
jgi:hypothetical protein